MPETDVNKQAEAQTPKIEEANKSEQAMSETKNDVHALQQNVETTGQITGQTDALKFSVFLNLDLSKQEHFDQVTDMLLKYFKQIKKDSNFWQRNFGKVRYTPDAKDALINLRKGAKDRIRLLENYRATIEKKQGLVDEVIPQTYVIEVTKMLKDVQAFHEVSGKAASGMNASEMIRNADHSYAGVVSNISRQKKHQEYQNKINKKLFEDVVRTLDSRDQADMMNYLIAVEEGQINNPSMVQYYQQHKADILYLCCLNSQISSKVCKHYNIQCVSRQQLGRHWNKLPAGIQQQFAPDGIYYFVNPEAVNSIGAQQLGGARKLLRDGIEAITPKMTPRQREMWAQGAELAIAGVAIWQLGKWLFGKKDGKSGFWGKAATLALVGVGGSFASQAFLGKDLKSVFGGLLNGGKDWEDIKQTLGFGNKEFIEQAVQKPLDGLYLFGGMTVAEVQNLLKLNPKSEIYFALERKFSGDNSPNGVEAMRILKQLDKNDPSPQLQAYFNAITGNPYTGDPNAKMESLADINAVNLNKIKILLEKYPALEQDESKQNELMNRLKTDKDFLSGNIESILASGFFKLKEEYQTKFGPQIDGLPISFEEKLALRQELHRIENTVNVNIQGFELETHGEEIVLKAGGNREVKLNIKNKTLDGLVNTVGSEIPFETAEEALRVGFLILTLKGKIISQELHSDKLKKEDFGWPFDLSDGISQIWNGIGSIVFKEAGGTQRVVMGDLIPFWSTMDRKYPTIEKGDNRKFLIAHLNKIWELEAPNN
ncbi:hypothetical protein D8B45_06030 [Candidatus Gracilibacteria bacterium]|nr:MAG: hypothetical protein D8B45_06030 [Candidatus Gracilibacteria bacterium]